MFKDFARTIARLEFKKSMFFKEGLIELHRIANSEMHGYASCVYEVTGSYPIVYNSVVDRTIEVRISDYRQTFSDEELR